MKKKVLMLGDSFLYGHSAENFTSSFANNLLAKGYYVYNTGISGADVTQYKAIADKYIPIIPMKEIIIPPSVQIDKINEVQPLGGISENIQLKTTYIPKKTERSKIKNPNRQIIFRGMSLKDIIELTNNSIFFEKV